MNNTENITSPIVLVGLMGVGKTHIGRALAHRIERDFFDSDKIIEEKAAMSIPEIFERFGEEKFRDSEHKTILEVLEKGACVLSIGGGALMNKHTLEALKSRSIMIWIDAPLDIIWERIKNCKNRPLLQSENPRQTLEDLLHERTPLYKQAHIHIHSEEQHPRLMVEEIIKLLSEHANEDKV